MFTLCTRSQSGRGAGIAGLWLYAWDCTLWIWLVFHIRNLKNVRSKGTGYLHLQRCSNVNLETKKTQWKPYYPRRCFLNASHFSSSAIMPVKFVIFPIVVSMSSWNMFPKHWKYVPIFGSILTTYLPNCSVWYNGAIRTSIALKTQRPCAIGNWSQTFWWIWRTLNREEFASKRTYGEIYLEIYQWKYSVALRGNSLVNYL